jgi:hypothetical protein
MDSKTMELVQRYYPKYFEAFGTAQISRIAQAVAEGKDIEFTSSEYGRNIVTGEQLQIISLVLQGVKVAWDIASFHLKDAKLSKTPPRPESSFDTFRSEVKAELMSRLSKEQREHIQTPEFDQLLDELLKVVLSRKQNDATGGNDP